MIRSSYWKYGEADFADWFSGRYPEIDDETCAKVGAYVEGLVKAILEDAS